ncbi:MAG: hypothetical protein MMC33_002010 [Icmadophila ericetorum]|nr:hypothetical protein [Icmadophila ericetorum]
MPTLTASLPAIILASIVTLSIIFSCLLYRDLISKPRVPVPGIKLPKSHPMEVERQRKKCERQKKKKQLHRVIEPLRIDVVDLEAQKEKDQKDKCDSEAKGEEGVSAGDCE